MTSYNYDRTGAFAPIYPSTAVEQISVEVNLGAICDNLNVLKRLTARTHVKVWGVVKTGAYGHGLLRVAQALEGAGVQGLCVSQLDEALWLRQAGIKTQILVMGGYYGPNDNRLGKAINHKIIPALSTHEQIDHLASLATFKTREFHLRVDVSEAHAWTKLKKARALLEHVVREPKVSMTGLMGHLSHANQAEPVSANKELDLFKSIRSDALRLGLNPLCCHIANSGAALGWPSSHYDAIRPGLALYGVAPYAPHGYPGLQPAMKVSTVVTSVRQIMDGDHLGYYPTWVAKDNCQIASIQMGYADGLPRALSNKGSILIRGQRAPIVGQISMNLASVDVTKIPGVAVGDEAVVLGKQGSNTITVEEIAQTAGMIPWEVLTTITALPAKIIYL